LTSKNGKDSSGGLAVNLVVVMEMEEKKEKRVINVSKKWYRRVMFTIPFWVGLICSLILVTFDLNDGAAAFYISFVILGFGFYVATGLIMLLNYIDSKVKFKFV
jgi:hypothetical protein